MARKYKETPAETVDRVRIPKGEDPAASVQSGDLQGLSDREEADSESVRELLEEGQAFEAEIVSSVENAPPADAEELKPREVPEDDVPPEYVDRDLDEPKEE